MTVGRDIELAVTALVTRWPCGAEYAARNPPRPAIHCDLAKRLSGEQGIDACVLAPSPVHLH